MNTTEDPSTQDKAREIADKALNEVKNAGVHAWSALKELYADPIHGQLKAYESLGPANALRAGLMLLAVFSVANYALISFFLGGVQQLIGTFMGAFGGESIPSNSRFEPKLILFCAIPAAAVFLSYLLVSVIPSDRKKDFAACTFCAGFSTLPLTIWFLYLRILGAGNISLLALVSLLCLSTTFILISSGLQDVFQLGARKTVLLTPMVTAISALVSQRLYAILW